MHLDKYIKTYYIPSDQREYKMKNCNEPKTINITSGNVKKAMFLLALFFVGGMTKGLIAEEVIGTILFSPTKRGGSGENDFAYVYPVSTTGNLVVNRELYAMQSAINKDAIFNTLTNYYLNPNTKFVFEDKGLKPFEEFELSRIIAIDVNGQMIELSEMFPIDLIKYRLPYLYEKLVREGRAK